MTFSDLVAARNADAAAAGWLDGAARALGHLVATIAGALQTTCIVLAGEDLAVLAESPAMHRLMTTPLTFNDWARGAAVVGIQNVLGAP